MKKCCFIGHRDSPGIEETVNAEVKILIAKGITEFYSGGMGNFDQMCEQAVKKFGGKITFIPYNYKQIREKDKLWYDSIFCPLGENPYSKFDIPKRNRWLDKTAIYFYAMFIKTAVLRIRLIMLLRKISRL